jgi:hypothetical protein
MPPVGRPQVASGVRARPPGKRALIVCASRKEGECQDPCCCAAGAPHEAGSDAGQGTQGLLLRPRGASPSRTIADTYAIEVERASACHDGLKAAHDIAPQATLKMGTATVRLLRKPAADAALVPGQATSSRPMLAFGGLLVEVQPRSQLPALATGSTSPPPPPPPPRLTSSKAALAERDAPGLISQLHRAAGSRGRTGQHVDSTRRQTLRFAPGHRFGSLDFGPLSVERQATEGASAPLHSRLDLGPCLCFRLPLC